MLAKIKKNWRVLLVVVLLVFSIALIFGVTGLGGGQDTGEDSVTALQFGLELDGGTRFTTPLHGVTAEEVDVGSSPDEPQLERDIADSLGEGVPPTDVAVKSEANDQTGEILYHIEVTSSQVTVEQLESALAEQNISADTVRDGVTEDTRQRTVEVITNKINEAGLSGGSARITTSATGEKYVVVEVPGGEREEVRDILDDKGAVRIDVYYPTTNDEGEVVYETEEAVLEQEDFQTIGTATQSDTLGPHVPVTLTSDAAQDFRDSTENAGMVPDGSQCYYSQAPENTDACLLTKVDGEVVYSAGMSPDLAGSIGSGEWEKSPNFVLQTSSMEEASTLSLHLNAGALPAGLDFDEGTSEYISPTQGERFKMASLLIGLLAVFGVGAKTYFRYRDLKVSLPMIAMSISEVIILGGFAALVGYPIDLAVVAGFIAVIGTGVDDLIIIANEVLAKGDVNSTRVFQNRYKKAFWIIMAAGITTTIALSPLIVLSLGALSGFAIFTIFGIIVGVSITRPAYGTILNQLLTDD